MTTEHKQIIVLGVSSVGAMAVVFSTVRKSEQAKHKSV